MDRPFAGFNEAIEKEIAMTKAKPFAVEIAAQIALAFTTGLFVSIVLAGATMLLAA